MANEEKPQYVMAIDEGTTSTRCIIFDHAGQIVTTAQEEFTQILPKAGWVEHNPKEIWSAIRITVGDTLARAQINRHQLAAVGITNQRETTVVWDRHTGEPVYNAIVWQDARTEEIVSDLIAKEGANKYIDRVGVPISTYFSAFRIKWILDNVPGVRERAEAGDLYFGNMNTWVLWNLTGGINGGVHITDVTNASRTMLMNIRTLQWDEGVCKDLDIPMSVLPEIRSSSEVYGYGAKNSLLIDTPIAGILGDQQAATFGQACFNKGQAKNTYGTGNFMLMNTGEEPMRSSNGLITTVLYQLGGQKPVYALEGSVAVTGSLVQWLRDNLGIISSSSEVEELASQVEDAGGTYIVPAFSGLYAPYWRTDARGVIVGLTRYINRNHIARAVLESTAFQSADLLDAMNKDSGVTLQELRVDGGMTVDEILMQFQADLLGVDVVRPKVTETTALGAAYAAGLAVGFWDSTQDVIDNWAEDKRWSPRMDTAERDRRMRLWHKAVDRTLNWVDEDTRVLSE
ncbi:glycerol kinase GlpK [Neoactinobaculum massilliense]|uniref:glycerol kinase GlpK n=1 Tax=Neoactinobaculum massilliense TaxID=2364794 RepID=UPI000F53124F|nr:glycerol kinase GlpK [Neoactinobaculum massilliense]